MAAESINVAIDSRLEFLQIVQYGSGDREMVRVWNSRYRGDVDRAFPGFGALAQKMVELRRRGYAYQVPVDVMLDTGYDFVDAEALPAEAGHVFDSKAEADDLNRRLRNYAAHYDFNAFLASHADFYQRLVADAAGAIAGRNYVKDIEDYYGLRQESYTILLASLYGGGLGLRRPATSGLLDVYNVMGPDDVDSAGVPRYTSPVYFDAMCYHEFSHSFVNPFTEKNWAMLSRYSDLYRPTISAYNNWQAYLNEQIVRAAVIRLKVLHVPGTSEAAEREREEASGFAYTGAFLEALHRYESNRSVYRTLDDFLPECLSVLDKLR